MNKRVIIGICVVIFAFVLVSTVYVFSNKPVEIQEQIPANNTSIVTNPEFVEFMNVRFTPAKFPGLSRDMEKYAINFTEQDLESVPKVKQMLEHALSAPRMQLCNMITLEENSPPSKYKIITLRPFSFLAQSY
ncbi:MAG: hypothetical protein QXE84_08180, partial [Candidatus Nitrosotenuis sp.]